MVPLKVRVVDLACPRGAATARRVPGSLLISFDAWAVRGKRPFSTPYCQMASSSWWNAGDGLLK